MQLMKIILFIVFSFLCCPLQAQQLEAQSRTGEVQNTTLDTISQTDIPFHKTIQKPIVLKTIPNSSTESYTELVTQKKTPDNKRFLKHLKFKKTIVADTSKPSRGVLQRLGCFLREPLELIVLGVEMFELTKPPKNNAFLAILYVIYIVPLFAIITAFIMGGVTGLATFILACGIFSFFVYWGILALVGISMGGLFLLWGLIGAFIIGLVLYLILIQLC